jgi:hypothetical protein
VSSDQPEWRVIVPGKETVVRRRGANWSFTLPEQHRIRINNEHRTVRLETPLEGTTYELAGVEETDDEVIVRLGAEISRGGVGAGGERGYPLPEIQDERARLQARWERLGLPIGEFHAYPQGATHEDKLRELRRRLREAGPAPAA